ncbi:MAG: tRNA uridine-5-carboxymethylaminomethyl(34) synthesis GTPase MnmE [Campylobacterales bacterium]
MSDTIVAIATASGVGSISIVRLSGDDALKIASKLISPPLTPRYATLKNIYDSSKNIIDKAIVIYFKAPASFSGEDVVEFQTHGGDMVANLLLDELLKNGARLAKPGEFSKRAFLNNKADMIELESISTLIESKSQDSARLMTKQLKGELRDKIDEFRTKLLETLAIAEVNIDYAEEELPKDSLVSIKNSLKEIKEELNSIIYSSEARESMLKGFKLSIIGRPNVGKSSLLNRLLMFERAIVSSSAGTTRDTIEESIKIGSHIVRIVDTAGIRESSEEIESIGIERSLTSALDSEVILALFDSSSALRDDDFRVLEFIKTLKEKKVFILINKCDLKRGLDINALPKEYETIELSLTQNLNRLNDALKSYLDKNVNYDEIMLTSKRQQIAANEALKNIINATNLVDEGVLELFSYEIQGALKALESISKPYANDEMLDEMFSSFCLGK